MDGCCLGLETEVGEVRSVAVLNPAVVFETITMEPSREIFDARRTRYKGCWTEKNRLDKIIIEFVLKLAKKQVHLIVLVSRFFGGS